MGNSSATPGSLCQSERPQDVDDGTRALMPTPSPAMALDPDDIHVSFEIGRSYLPVPTGLTGLDPSELQVLAWLRHYRGRIVAAESEFRVDRRAIAGAIAWEMLKNVAGFGVRAVGPGKIHLYNSAAGTVMQKMGLSWTWSWSATGDPFAKVVAEEVEARGYLPAQSFASRKAMLATPEGAIRYVAAIMAAAAEIAVRCGFEDIRSNPVVLTNIFQSKTLASWEAALKARTAGAPLVAGKPGAGNTMDIWVAGHLPYLEDGVGKPELPESAP
jgi:hypothetical protein